MNDRSRNRTIIFSENSTASYGQIFHQRSTPSGIASDKNGDIYIGLNDRVERWSPASLTTSTLIMRMNSSCSTLFLDQSSTLYCSLAADHRVIMHQDGWPSTLATVVAGTGACEMTSLSLCSPAGLYVDSNSHVYVADTKNDRVQEFISGNNQGTTVVGINGYAFYPLAQPTAITMDEQGYLLVADQWNRRIIRCISSMCRCEIGCDAEFGRKAFSLSKPFHFLLDPNDHSLYILLATDRHLFKFYPTSEYCGKLVIRHWIEKIGVVTFSKSSPIQFTIDL